jgi:hypothetical protein
MRHCPLSAESQSPNPFCTCDPLALIVVTLGKEPPENIIAFSRFGPIWILIVVTPVMGHCTSKLGGPPLE